LGFGPNPKLVEHVREADLLLLVGSRMSEVPSQGYTLLDIPVPGKKVVHVHPDTAELGRVYQPTLAINAAPVEFVQALESISVPASAARADYLDRSRKTYLAWSDTAAIQSPGDLQMARVIDYLNQHLPDDAIVCNG